MSENVKRQLAEKRKLQRKIRKKSKPTFRRYLSWRFWKFERREYWRKPKGNDSKMRLQIKGYPPIVKVGYGTDSSIRNLHPSGLIPVRVFNENELDKLDPNKHIIIIGASVGLKKRLRLISVAKAKGFRIANA